MGRWSRRLSDPFLDFAGTGPNENVLDLGCGTGHLAGAVTARTADGTVEGIDLAPVYIAYAIGKYTDPRIRFSVGDACALDAADASFDRVLAQLVLHFVPRPELAIAHMRRVARPGAVVSATVWDARGGLVANRLFFDTAAALDPRAAGRRARNYTRLLTRPGELGAAWRQAGLNQVQETPLHIRMDYGSFADFWSPYLGCDGPGAEYVGSLDGAARNHLEAAVRAAYLDGETDGPRSYAALAWAVRGFPPQWSIAGGLVAGTG